MKAYEALVILDSNLSEEDRAAAIKRISDLVTGGGSTLDNIDEWGKRKLAFEIDKHTEGDYILAEFHADPSAIAEIDRVLRITDAVVRFIIIQRDEKKS
ncbi:MAG: 30S ribosomal protein S6 [Actinomycetia bacterium]|nr:30S ribosomal protein S6 [Actinomycetes bacterium]